MNRVPISPLRFLWQLVIMYPIGISSLNAQVFLSAGGASSPLFNSANTSLPAPDGGYWLAGQFQSPTVFPGLGTRQSAGSRDVFLLKLDSTGASQFVRTFGGSQYDEPFGLGPAPAQGLYMCGQFRGTTRFDTLVRTSLGDNDAFLARLDASGQTRWLQTLGGKMKSVAFSVDSDSAGNAYVGGFFQDSVWVGGQWFEGSAHNLFLASYDSLGAFRWFRFIPSGLNDEILDLDVQGNALVAVGFFSQTLQAPQAQSSAGLRDGFVLRYSLEGEFDWLRTLAGSGEEFLYGVEQDRQGRIFCTGSGMGGSLGNQGYATTPGGWLDAVVGALSPAGQTLWIRTAGSGQGHAQGNHLALGPRGVYTTGLCNGPASFGAIVLSNGQSFQAFLARYGFDGTLAWVRAADGPGNDGLKTLSIRNQRLLVAGDGSNGIAFDGFSPVLGGSTNAVWALLDDTTSIPTGRNHVSVLPHLPFRLTGRKLELPENPGSGLLQVWDAVGRLHRELQVPFGETTISLPETGWIRWIPAEGRPIVRRFWPGF